MEIFIITICNKNNDSINKFVEKYSLLIKKFYKINFIDINFYKNNINNNNYKKEYEKALSLIKPDSILVALDEKGQNYNSLQFSENITIWKENFSNLFFLIGGPDGLSDDVKSRADEIISLSKLTFPHLLARVILVEQIYRSICIMSNHPYHRV
ncbi:MAG: 23S rRNA (pseudouridine(1915)-N(3))-methyltransferase RlmH [Gammaproteobacteria bacterium]|jgi:23S rRNA (pseudouridine1915-N3)-methyltransferase|nr:23S rRNA (pseudouridine(1915)-N(3))-methyltransferase RlmH [Gammaproteobacteria bacterium]MBT7603534.1 23S rRNA (pseudouridine(1915)-N(3))-methyltransferase RlmH [Gammaproteobacteria bacterium]